jgi:NADPH-dependent 2,4-dienoyl-CoA reductase/sulfur reductase-like enzyme
LAAVDRPSGCHYNRRMTTILDRVIVGNGAAAAEAVLALRRGGFRGAIDLFALGRRPPYNPMLGSYYVSGALEGGRCFPFGDDRFYGRNLVRFHAATPVAHIDPAARLLTTAAGECFSYDQCLVATGASTAVPPVPGLAGLAGPGVFVLRSFDDAVLLRGAVAAAKARAAGVPPRALVLGASFAGVETASVLCRLGLEVTIVEPRASVLPRAAHPACAEVVERHLRARGLDLRLGVSASAVVRHDRGLLVILEAGAEAFDLAVVCTGSCANLGLLAASGLTTGGAIDVDDRCRTAAPGLLAAGDVARTVDPVSGERVVVALWSSARRQGRTAGLTMAGQHASCPPDVPCNIQHAGELLFASGGSLEAADAVEIDESRGAVAVLGFSGGRLVGFNLLGDVRRAGLLAGALGRVARHPAAGAPMSTAAALAAVREGMRWTLPNAV